MTAGTNPPFGKERTMKNENTALKATIREFAESIRSQGLSDSIREIQIAVAVERLAEEHGIEVDADKFARLVG